MKFVRKIIKVLKRPKRYWHIFHTISRIKPVRIMEIGTWTGDRALKMIKRAQKYRAASEVEYYGFDLFELMTPEIYFQERSKWPSGVSEVRAKLEATGAKINLYKGDTTKILPGLASSLPKMDLIFIDGGHSLKTIASDWKYANMLMNQKTVVIFDDYWQDRLDAGAKATVDKIDRKKFYVKPLFIEDHFKKTNFGDLKIKLIAVKKRSNPLTFSNTCEDRGVDF